MRAFRLLVVLVTLLATSASIPGSVTAEARVKDVARVLGIRDNSLIGYGLYRYGVLDRLAAVVAPDKKAEGTVSKDDFANVGESTPSTVASSSSSVPAAGGRLNRPIRVGIVTWGGYAGGIVANGGFAPNRESTFPKEFGVQVELLVIDDFTKSRDAFRAGGDKGGVDTAGWEIPFDDGFFENALARTARAVAGIREGRIVPEPADPGKCRYCDSRDTCRIGDVVEAATAEGA